MQPEPKKHVSHAIAWSLIALLAGSLAFVIWAYFNQISDIYDNSFTISISHKKTASTKPTTTTTGSTVTTDTTADWKTYTNDTYGFSFKYPKEWSEGTNTLNSTDTNTRKSLVFKLGTKEIAQILLNFEGGFEDASYYRKGEVKNNKISIIRSEDWTSNSDTKQAVLFMENFSANNSLYLIYNYTGENKTEVALFDKIITTFTFTK